ncbi:MULTISPECIES: TonB-dependent receptor [Fusobacterium]|uniref:TonB-dependent receptor n=1 Tax=Fusobacterium hominis TaxID=2764326 RepID=A0A7G9GUV6_9FUSO|nr:MULTISPECIES: TonB-dependent receptor [Fusobacterium]QNM14588.1 TonB-dependent receptor [Fusobacterium hominis]
MKKYLLLMSMLVVASSIYAENSARLDETVVSATGFETTVKDEVKNITVITKEDIERKNYSTVEEILKDSPFVQTVNTSYGVRFDMRGQGERASSRVKILVDGIPVNMMNMLYGTECAFPVNNIPVDQIQKIEIVPGGGGVLYGSGTSGGFINIVTATKLGNYAKVGATYGSYDNKKMDVVTGVQVTDKLFADINYTGRNSDGYRDTEKTEIDNLIGKIRYDFDKNQRLMVKIEKYTENYHRTGSLTKKQLEEDRRQADPDNYRDGKLTKENYLVGYVGKYNDFEVTTTGFIENSHDKQLQDVGTSLSTFWTKEKKEGANLRGKYSYNRGDLILGYDFLREKADSIGNGVMGGNYYDVTKDTNSIYALNRFDITQKFQFTAGVRGEFANYKLESIDKKKKKVEGKPSLDNYGYEAAFNYLYSKTGNIYIKYEKSFTSPNATEFFDKDFRYLKTKNNSSGMDKKDMTKPPKMDKKEGTSKMAAMRSNTLGTKNQKMLPNMMGKGKMDSQMMNSKGGMPNSHMMTKSNDVEAYYLVNNIKPEKTDTIELGVRDVIGNVYVSATTYYSQTKDEISKNSQMSPGVGPIWNYRNFGKTERKGVELYSEQYFNKLTLNESLSYVDAKIKSGKDKGKEIPYVSKWRGTFGGEYRIIDNLAINLVGNVYSKSFNGWTAGKNSSEKGYKKGFTTVDMSARYTFNNGLMIIAGINNIFNEKYYLSENKHAEKKVPNTMPPKYEITGSYMPAPERNYYVGFRYEI